MSEIQYNYYPLDISSSAGVSSAESTAEKPQVNTTAVASDASNMVSTGGGSVMALGKLQSANFVHGEGGAGWMISNWEVEFNNISLRGSNPDAIIVSLPRPTGGNGCIADGCIFTNDPLNLYMFRS